MMIPPADHSHLTSGQLLMIGAAVEAAADRDYNVLMSPGGRDRLTALDSLIATRRIDGLLLTEAQVRDVRVRRAQQSGMPFVVLGRTTDWPDYDWVDLDWDYAVRTCVQHLVSVGRRQLALISRSAELVAAKYGSAVRSDKAFRRAIALAGIEGVVVACDDNAYAAAGCVGELMSELPGVDGIVTINEMSLPGLVPALADAGKRIPQDLSLCAVAAAPLAPGQLKLTTVSNPLAEMATCAVDTLISRISDAAGKPVHLLFAPPLEVRVSSIP